MISSELTNETAANAESVQTINKVSDPGYVMCGADYYNLFFADQESDKEETEITITEHIPAVVRRVRAGGYLRKQGKKAADLYDQTDVKRLKRNKQARERYKIRQQKKNKAT